MNDRSQNKQKRVTKEKSKEESENKIKTPATRKKSLRKEGRRKWMTEK